MLNRLKAFRKIYMCVSAFKLTFFTLSSLLTSSNHCQYVTQSANARLKTIEALKLKHREGMTCKQKEHAEAMAIKNQEL